MIPPCLDRRKGFGPFSAGDSQGPRGQLNRIMLISAAQRCSRERLAALQLRERSSCFQTSAPRCRRVGPHVSNANRLISIRWEQLYWRTISLGRLAATNEALAELAARVAASAALCAASAATFVAPAASAAIRRERFLHVLGLLLGGLPQARGCPPQETPEYDKQRVKAHLKDIRYVSPESYFKTTLTFSQAIPCVAANTLATVSATA